MPIRTIYFDALIHAVKGMALHSDECIARPGKRFSNLFHLLDYKTRASGLPSIEDNHSGLPVLPDVIRVENDINKQLTSSRPIDEVKKDMLDEMIIGKRMPTHQQIEDIAIAAYVNELHKYDLSSKNQFIIGSNALTIHEIEPSIYDDWDDYKIYAWDYWPASTNHPVTTQIMVEFGGNKETDSVSLFVKELIRIAHEYTGNGAKILELAKEVDKIQQGRVKEFCRVTMRKFETGMFFASSDEIKERLGNIENESKAWALHFDVERLKSRGTVTKPRGFLNSTIFNEDYYINKSREATQDRKCSEFDHHVVMTSESYKALSSMPEYQDNVIIHVVSGDGKTLKENI